MRYYNITLTDPKSGASIVQSPTGGFTRGTGPTFSSLAKLPFTGQTVIDPGALDINFDIPVSNLATPTGAFRIKVFGPSLQMLGQASQLVGMHFTMSAGMYKGLPLATYQTPQAGVIAVGNVFESYGNFQGVDQTLDLLVLPGAPQKKTVFGSPVSFQWLAGTSLDDALNATLAAAYPGFKVQVFIDANLTLPNDEAGYYQSLPQFASYLAGLTLELGSQTYENYSGVQIGCYGDTIIVQDGTNTFAGPGKAPVKLAFSDLIGQPTWVGGTKVQFNTVLRANIQPGNRVTFPTEILPPYALTSPSVIAPGNSTPVNSKIGFQGTFLVNYAQHFGQFRDPDAGAWCTAFQATSAPVKR